MNTTAIKYIKWKRPPRNIIEFNTLRKEYETLRNELKSFVQQYLNSSHPIPWEEALTKLSHLFDILESRPEFKPIPNAENISEEKTIYGPLFHQQLTNIHDELSKKYQEELADIDINMKKLQTKEARQKLSQLKGWPTKQPKMHILWFQIQYSECNMKLSKLERSLKKARYTIYSRWFSNN